jgi:hypothetical protein
MPAVSKSQQRYMAGCLHNPAHMYGKCPSEKVSREFATTGGAKNLPESKSSPKTDGRDRSK